MRLKCRNLKKHLKNIAKLALANITGKITFFNTVTLKFYPTELNL